MSVESQDRSNISDHENECSFEYSTISTNERFRKFKEENDFDEENEVQEDPNLNWLPDSDVNKVS